MRVDYTAEYDSSDSLSIEAYSQKMVGKTFREICEEDDARQLLVLRDGSAAYGTAEVSSVKRNMPRFACW